jgi:hypothetical protein
MLQRRYAHLFGPDGRPDVVERLQAGADRNIRRFGLLADEHEADLPGPATDAAGRAADEQAPVRSPDEDTNLTRLLVETHGGPR